MKVKMAALIASYPFAAAARSPLSFRSNPQPAVSQPVHGSRPGSGLRFFAFTLELAAHPASRLEYRRIEGLTPIAFICSGQETTRLLESGTSAINQQVSAKNKKTGCDIVRIIEVARLRTVRGDEKIEVDPE